MKRTSTRCLFNHQTRSYPATVEWSEGLPAQHRQGSYFAGNRRAGAGTQGPVTTRSYPVKLLEPGLLPWQVTMVLCPCPKASVGPLR